MAFCVINYKGVCGFPVNTSSAQNFDKSDNFDMISQHENDPKVIKVVNFLLALSGKCLVILLARPRLAHAPGNQAMVNVEP